MKTNILYLLSILMFLISCEDIQETGPEEMGKGRTYFPLKVGQAATYQVTKTTHKELIPDITERYQLKQVVAAKEEGSDFDTYRLELYVRANSTRAWELDSVWSIRDEAQKMVQQESNVPYLKAVFPLRKGLFWDGNVYNHLGKKQYTVEAMDEAYTLAGKTYPKALNILQSSGKSLLHKDFRREVYTEAAGLVHKRVEFYQYINDSQNAFYGKDSIIGGTFYEQTLIE